MHETVPFLPEHIFSLDICNLDRNTENFDLDFYFYYLLNHAEDMFVCIDSSTNYANNNIKNNAHGIHTAEIIGYMIGKTCPDTTEYKMVKNKINKTHVSALSITPSHRSRSLGTILMNLLEENGNNLETYFSDLFVKVTNKKAIDFYKNRGYFIYRRIYGYYKISSKKMPEGLKNLFSNNEEEDAFDMRRGLRKDVDGFFSSFIGKNVKQSEMDN